MAYPLGEAETAEKAGTTREADSLQMLASAVATTGPDLTGFRAVQERTLRRPVLISLVDLEEEFDWKGPFSRENVALTHLHALPVAQARFDAFGVRPTYLADYPVVASDFGAEFLSRTSAEGRCELGAQLHPWVNPPHDEVASVRNSYPGNLAFDVERRKIEALTDLIERRCGMRPRVFKAGRYGLGPSTIGIIKSLGYLVDTSVMPFTSYVDEGGPDYSEFDRHPFWLGAGEVLELPSTRAFVGRLRNIGAALYPRVAASTGRTLHVGAFFARLGLLERVTLSPEGNNFDDQRRLVDAMLEDGHRVLVFSFHSPSLSPGHTPYVRSDADRDQFLATIERLLEYMLVQVGAEPMTTLELHRRLAADLDPLQAPSVERGRQS